MRSLICTNFFWCGVSCQIAYIVQWIDSSFIVFIFKIHFFFYIHVVKHITHCFGCIIFFQCLCHWKNFFRNYVTSENHFTRFSAYRLRRTFRIGSLCCQKWFIFVFTEQFFDTVCFCDFCCS